MSDRMDHETRQQEILREPEAPDKYQKSIAKGLDKAFTDKQTDEQQLELSTAKVIIFSDHHKGARDPADDFQRCERAYHAALAYYLETGHRLVVLGDVEELWECKPKEVLDAYPKTLALEAEYRKKGGYDRFWGNHDDQWRHEDQVSKLLLGQHIESCMADAFKSGSKSERQRKIEELLDVFTRFTGK